MNGINVKEWQIERRFVNVKAYYENCQRRSSKWGYSQMRTISKSANVARYQFTAKGKEVLSDVKLRGDMST